MPSQELRHRRRGRGQNPEPLRNGEAGVSRGTGAPPSSDQAEVAGALGDLLSAGNTIAGCLVMVALSYQFSCYLCQLHENDLWFSEIMVSIFIHEDFHRNVLQYYNIYFLFRRWREKSLFEQNRGFIIHTSNN